MFSNHPLLTLLFWLFSLRTLFLKKKMREPCVMSLLRSLPYLCWKFRSRERKLISSRKKMRQIIKTGWKKLSNATNTNFIIGALCTSHLPLDETKKNRNYYGNCKQCIKKKRVLCMSSPAKAGTWSSPFKLSIDFVGAAGHIFHLFSGTTGACCLLYTWL